MKKLKNTNVSKSLSDDEFDWVFEMLGWKKWKIEKKKQ